MEEEPCSTRTEFQRDRDRIIHSKAFRRLMHKTQVFFFPEDEHYRTRMTHTLEVSQIARTIARALRLNEDLTDLLPNIKVPTLIFWGTLDTATPIADGRKMEKLIPDSGLIEYPGATHFSYLENIQHFNTVVNEFLKNDK